MRDKEQIQSELDAMSSRAAKKKKPATKQGTKPAKRKRRPSTRFVSVDTLVSEHCKAHGLDEDQIMEGFHLGIRILSDHLEKHQCVVVDGLGRFRWKSWKQRLGYNRYKTEQVIIPATDRLKFIPDEALKSPVQAASSDA